MMNMGSISSGWCGMLMAATLLVLGACAEPAGQDTGAAGEQAVAGADSGAPVGQAPEAPLPALAPAGAVTDQQAAEGTAAANDDSDVDQAIDTVLGGDHEVYRDVIDRVQKAVAAGDKAGVAALVSYPIEVAIGGKPRSIANASEFVAAWDSIVTPDIAQVVTAQKYSDLFVNWQGVMFGDGQVWITGVCRDQACTNSDVLITTIQPASP